MNVILDSHFTTHLKMPVRADAVSHSLPVAHHEPGKQRRPQTDNGGSSRAAKHPSSQIEDQNYGMEKKEQDVQRSKQVSIPAVSRLIVISVRLIHKSLPKV